MTGTATRLARLTIQEELDSGRPWAAVSVSPALHHTEWDFNPQVQDDPSLPGEGWVGAALDRLDQLAALGPAWDGAGAKTVSPRVLDMVRQFVASKLVRDTECKPELVPTFEGGIQLEWHTLAVDLVIESEPSGAVTCYYLDSETDEEFEGSLLDGEASLASAFQKLGHLG